VKGEQGQLAPKLAGESLEILRAHPWASVLTGLLFGLLAPPALLIAAIVTCGLGLSVALIGVQLLGILAYVGLAIPLLWVGMLILRKGTPSRYSAFLLGLLLLFAAGIIPVLGFLVWMAVAVLGFGAIMLALLARWGHPMVGHRPAPPAEAAPEAM
jgi:hypothetical protein